MSELYESAPAVHIANKQSDAARGSEKISPGSGRTPQPRSKPKHCIPWKKEALNEKEKLRNVNVETQFFREHGARGAKAGTGESQTQSMIGIVFQCKRASEGDKLGTLLHFRL